MATSQLSKSPEESRRKPQPESVPRGILQLFCRMISVILHNDSAGSAARAALSAGNDGSRVIMRHIPHVSIYRSHSSAIYDKSRNCARPRGRADSELLVDAELHQPPHARAVGIASVGFEGRWIPIQRIVDTQRELQTLPEPAATHVVAEE